VLGVGATEDSEGTKLAEYSSTGLPDIPASGPDVVSWGASRLNTAKVGTSFAAPRVSEASALCASAIEQVAHSLATQRGEAVGVPLIGYGWIDRDFAAESVSPRDPIPAQPAVSVDREGLARSVAACKEAGIALDVSVRRDRLRTMIISSARPIPNARPHEVGAGFVNAEVVIEWLARWTTKHLAWFFASEAPSSRAFELLPDAPIFAGVEELTKLAIVLGASAPHWRWDFARSEFSWRPDSALPH